MQEVREEVVRVRGERLEDISTVEGQMQEVQERLQRQADGLRSEKLDLQMQMRSLQDRLKESEQARRRLHAPVELSP